MKWRVNSRMSRRVQSVFGAVILLCVSPLAHGDATELRLLLDADRQGHLESAEAIELGVRTALAERGNRVAGYDISVVPLDHRGNVKRSKLNMLAYLKDDRALAVFGGLHSPPYLRYQSFINANRVLLLLPWSAAGPLTRVRSGENWIFRLSVDDTKAADRLVDFALNTRQCKQPGMVLWESGWGRTNEKTLSAALMSAGMPSIPTFYFQGNLERSDAYHLANKVAEAQVDCVLLIANSPDGVEVVSELARLPNAPRITSHWGITGADFEQHINHARREIVGLHFLQTCYPFDAAKMSERLERAWQTARRLDSSLGADITTLRAPAGFFHGYDLTLILMAALEQHPGITDVKVLRQLVHNTLESLDSPVLGLMRLHSQPFSAFSEDNPDAHEALGLGDLCMARWNDSDRIEIVPGQLALTGRE